mmetsp:Transcript_6229/g.7020  ORF Transcript_6229/g.7020 Transcript_6229/m.7020 type:complete len:358 (-) Transcript_6229:40-1113(-)
MEAAVEPPLKVSILTLIGLPGSGKSTFCSQFSTITPPEVLVIPLEVDAIIKHLKSKNTTSESSQTPWYLELHLWQRARTLILDLLKAISSSLHTPTPTILPTEIQNLCTTHHLPWQPLHTSHTSYTSIVLIVDDNNHYGSMRKKYLRIAQTYNCCYAEMLFNLPLGEIMDQNRGRFEPLPDEIITRMASKLEPPDATKKGFLVIHALATQDSYCHFEPKTAKKDDFLEMLSKIENSVVERIGEDDDGVSPDFSEKVEQLREVRHGFDIRSRKILGEKVKQSGNKNGLAKTINQLRRGFMDEIKRAERVVKSATQESQKDDNDGDVLVHVFREKEDVLELLDAIEMVFYERLESLSRQ